MKRPISGQKGKCPKCGRKGVIFHAHSPVNTYLGSKMMMVCRGCYALHRLNSDPRARDRARANSRRYYRKQKKLQKHGRKK